MQAVYCLRSREDQGHAHHLQKILKRCKPSCVGPRLRCWTVRVPGPGAAGRAPPSWLPFSWRSWSAECCKVSSAPRPGCMACGAKPPVLRAKGQARSASHLPARGTPEAAKGAGQLCRAWRAKGTAEMQPLPPFYFVDCLSSSRLLGSIQDIIN